MGIPLQETTSTIESVPKTDPPYLRPSSLPRPRSDSLHNTVYAQSDATLRLYTTSTYVYLSACTRKPSLTTIRPRCGRYTIEPNHPRANFQFGVSPRSCDALHAHQRGSPRPTALRRVQHDPGAGAHGGSLLCGAHGTVLKFRPPRMRSEIDQADPVKRGPVLKRVRSSYKCVILRSH